MTLLDVIGWLGTACISLSAIPQAIKIHKQGHADGITWWYILGIYAGFWLLLIYSLPKPGHAVTASYVINITTFSYIILRKRFPRKVTACIATEQRNNDRCWRCMLEERLCKK